MKFNVDDGIDYEGQQACVVDVEELENGRQLLWIRTDDGQEYGIYNDDDSMRGDPRL